MPPATTRKKQGAKTQRKQQKPRRVTAIRTAKALRSITRQEAIESYQELQGASTATNKEPGRSRIGLKALDYTMLPFRLETKTQHKFSFLNALRDPVRSEKLRELVVRYKKKPLREFTPDGLLKAQYSVFQLYYGTINQFRPMVAKWVYEHYRPKVGILDFSAGWGGRMLAAMSLGIPYTGVDANTRLEKPYKAMIDLFYAGAGPKPTMIFRPSETVDFGRFDYDLIFTSPPYFMIEAYEEMPAYASKADFLDRFFRPVVRSAWKGLRRGGHMVLNMPAEMYDALKDVAWLPKIAEKVEMPLGNRHQRNAKKGVRLGSEHTASSEWMYVWRKA